MAIYIINILLIVLYSFVVKDRKKYVILVSLQLFLILACRSITLGVDLPNYYDGFYYIKNLNFRDMLSSLHFFEMADLVYPFGYESGYVFINWIVSHLGFSFHGFLVLCAFINIFSFGYFIYKYSDIPWLSFVILCTFGIYTYFFGIIRQSLALSIFLWSLHFAVHNKKIKSLLLFLLAFLFHRAILIMMPVYFFVNRKKRTRKMFIIALLLSFPFMLLSGPIYSNIIYPFMSFFGKGYTGHGMQLNNLIILLYIIAFGVAIFANFKKGSENKMNGIAIWAIILSIYIEIFGMYNDNFARVLQMYNVFLLITIPYVVRQYNNQKSIIFVKSLMVILLTSFFVYTTRKSEIVPYKIETENIIFEHT